MHLWRGWPVEGWRDCVTEAGMRSCRERRGKRECGRNERGKGGEMEGGTGRGTETLWEARSYEVMD